MTMLMGDKQHSPPTRLIMFDIDGTLVRSSAVDERCYAEVMREALGVEISTDWAQYEHVTDAAIAHELFRKHTQTELDDVTMQRLRHRFVERLHVAYASNQSEFTPMPGAAKTLAALGHHPNVSIAIATGGWGASARLKLQWAGIALDNLPPGAGEIPVACCDDHHTRAGIMQCALQQARDTYQVEHFTDITYIGDGSWDVKASHELGWGFIGIAESNAAEQRLRNAGAEIILRSHSPDSFLRRGDFRPFGAG